MLKKESVVVLIFVVLCLIWVKWPRNEKGQPASVEPEPVTIKYPTTIYFETDGNGSIITNNVINDVSGSHTISAEGLIVPKKSTHMFKNNIIHDDP